MIVVDQQNKSKNIEAIYPLSPMQQGMLFHTLYSPDSEVYFEQLSCTLRGDLNVSAFEQAWKQVVARHPVLRTLFVWENRKKPLQVVRKWVDLPWANHDWRSLSSVEQQEHLEAFLQADRGRGFELYKAPLMRCALIQIDENRYQFVWSHHHLLMDGWCLSIIFKEVLAFYETFNRGQDLHLEAPRPYQDYITWLQQQELPRAEAFWQQALQGFSAPTPLVVDKSVSNNSSQKESYDEHHLQLSTELTSALQSLARQHDLTLNTLVQGAWALLLSCYSGESDVVFGATVSGRPPALKGVESMVGLFINTLPVRVQISEDAELLPWLKQLREQQVEREQYSYSPLVEIQGWSEVTRGMPLFESILVFENYPVDASLRQQKGRLQISQIRSFERTNYPLTVAVVPGQELSLRISYDSCRFEAGTIHRMIGHFQTLLEAIVTNPQQQVFQLPLLTPAEWHQLVVEWNDTQTEYPQDQCIHQLLEAQAEQTPEAVAVVFEDSLLTYWELNARANQLAHHLQSLGVGPEVLLGICTERSLEMVVGLLGILKAGGAYVPLDPAYPQERLQFMLNDSQVSLLLTQEKLVAGLPEQKARVICLDTDWEVIAQENEENPVSGVEPENLAYVIYTSGSTGKPKGAMNTHRGISNRLRWMQETYRLTTADGVLQKTPFSFDVSVWEFFWPLLAGARLVVAKPGGHQDSAYLVELIAQQQITTLHFVPSMLRVFLEEQGLDTCNQCLRQVFCSGEALPFELQEHFFTRLGCELHNLYGPTEAAIDVTFWQCQREGHLRVIPIGRPIANMQAYILDSELQPVPIGVRGELHIGGAGLARGYLNRPELTEEKFIPNPFSDEPGARLYKTGDLARYLPDGNIEFLGRLDHQVKIRGFRIELGEIEAVLSQHPDVRENVVLAREDHPGDKRIVAYVVPNQEPPTTSELRRFLKQELPEYMVPSAFVMLDALPLTPNGKIDRRALPIPDQIRPELESGFVTPQTLEEKLLANIWAEVLGLKQVGIHDNFFELGGDSILSIQVVARANQAGLHLKPKQLFQCQTIAKLAAVASTTISVQAEQGLVTGPVPLTPIQQWFFEQHLPESHHFNQSVLLEVPPDLKLELLEQVVQQLLVHHDALRLRFVQDGNRWQQVNAASDETVPLSVVDLSEISSGKQPVAIETTAAELQASLNLSEGPILRVALFNLGPDQPGRLLLVIHHLAVDGVSWRILLEDLATAYQQLDQGLAIQLPPKTTSFQFWAQKLTDYGQSEVLASQLDYWLAHCRSKVPVLPVDYPSGKEANTVVSAAQVSVSLSEEQTQALLQEVPAAYNTQINDVLLTALLQGFAQWAGEHSMLVALEGHGREELFEGVDLSRTVGWFTTVFPVLLELGEADHPGEALKSVKEQLRRLPNRGIGYGILRYLSQDEARRLKLQALPQAEVSFNYLGQFDRVLSESTLLAPAKESNGPAHSPLGSRSHLLEVNGFVASGRLQLDWTYSENVYQRTTVERLAWGFMEALQSLIAHCQLPEAGGYTPSDFPLARVDRQTLDRIRRKGLEIEDLYPLSPMQQDMLCHTLAAPESGVYFTQLSCVLYGELKVSAFRQAWQQVVERHPILRCAFIWEGLDEPLQVVSQQVRLPWEQQDWLGLSPGVQQEQLKAFLQADLQQGFKLDWAPLMRCALIKVREDTYQFVWSNHHLLMDGWCLSIILKEVFAFYEAFNKGQNLCLENPRPYRDYIAWLQQQDLSQAEAFWRQALQGFTAPTSLIRGRTVVSLSNQKQTYNEQHLHLSATVTAALNSLAKQHHLTLNTLVQGAWALLLSCYIGESDVVFGATVSGRPATLLGVESMVGLFINTLPVRVQVSGEAFLSPWLQQLQAQQVEREQYSYSPLTEIRRWSDVPQGMPLFESNLRFQNYPMDKLPLQKWGGSLDIREVRWVDWWHYPLNTLAVTGSELLLAITYDGCCFDTAMITQILGDLKTLLEGFLVAPEQRLSTLLLLIELE